MSNERSFSVLRLIKTYLRSTMCPERLSSLAVLYVNRDISPDFDTFVKAFVRNQPRRLEFLFD